MLTALYALLLLFFVLIINNLLKTYRRSILKQTNVNSESTYNLSNQPQITISLFDSQYVMFFKYKI